MNATRMEPDSRLDHERPQFAKHRRGPIGLIIFPVALYVRDNQACIFEPGDLSLNSTKVLARQGGDFA